MEVIVICGLEGGGSWGNDVGRRRILLGQVLDDVG